MNKETIEYKEGDFVDFPKLMLTANKMICPVCGKVWEKTGSGYGFVKRSAGTHVGSCFISQLKALGLEMIQPYNMDKLAWQLGEINTTKQ